MRNKKSYTHEEVKEMFEAYFDYKKVSKWYGAIKHLGERGTMETMHRALNRANENIAPEIKKTIKSLDDTLCLQRLDD